MLLAACMEFKTPRSIMENFALPIIKKLLVHLLPECNKNENNYYTFAYRRMWAKLRRLAYFVPDCEKLYKRLLFDELSYYENVYDFTVF